MSGMKTHVQTGEGVYEPEWVKESPSGGAPAQWVSVKVVTVEKTCIEKKQLATSALTSKRSSALAGLP